MQRLSIRRIHAKKLATGLLLVALGVLMPLFLDVQNFGVYPPLYAAIRSQQKYDVLVSSLRLVTLNSLRGWPHYLGSFFIAESIELAYRGQAVKLFKAAIACAVIPPVYWLIERLHHIRYDFGVPAVMLILVLTVLGRVDFNLVGLGKKSLMVVAFVASLQFFDVMPYLAALPVGRGESSMDIKLVSRFVGADDALQATSTLFFCILFFLGVLLFLLIRDENNLRAMNELQEQNERMRMETRIRALESRTHMEMQHLVHDLKSPLTSIQALVGVLQLKSRRDNRVQDLEYLEKIERSVERLSVMISEILYENQRLPLTTAALMDTVLAQISISEYAPMLRVQNDASEQLVCVNRIRFARALVNIIENAFYAVDPATGAIDLHIDVQRQDSAPQRVRFVVTDNGRGIPKEALLTIWERGYSTRNSHGLGLSFVRSVIERSGGSIDIQSEEHKGTTVTVLLPEGEDCHE